MISASRVVSTAQQVFSVSEVLEIGQGKPEAEGVIRTDVTAIVQDTKTVANKMILKGEVLIKILYLGNLEEGELETMEYSVPVSQIVDADGVDETSTCDTKMEVLGYQVQIRTDSSGEDSLLAVDIKLAASVIAYTDTEIQIVTDALSLIHILTDFGIARFSRNETRTMTEKAIGSVHYIAPEQARGDITDERADIYSVGVMLYEMLTGKLPFEADNAVSVAIMQLQSEPKPPREKMCIRDRL